MSDAKVDAQTLMGVVVQPGDTLIVGISGGLTDQEADNLRDAVQAFLPGLRVAIIEANQLMVYRPAKRSTAS